MNGSKLYDEDFLLWTEQQADCLRRLGGSNSLDIEHLAEEIEDLGKRDLREVEGLLRQIFVHLLKVVFESESDAVRHWRAEILNFQADAENAFSPSMRQKLDLAKIWQKALQAALDSPSHDNPARISLGGQAHSQLYVLGVPLTLDDVFDPGFDLNEILAKVAACIAGDATGS